MVYQLKTELMQHSPFAEFTLDNIAKGMQTILTNNLTKRPRRSLHYFDSPLSVPSADPLDYFSNKHKPLLLMGPLTLEAKPPL